MKHIERLRKLINLALKNEWLEKESFAKFKKKFTKTNRECLTEMELKTVELKEFTIERLRFVKDLFAFSCYTGLAYRHLLKLDFRKSFPEGKTGKGLIKEIIEFLEMPLYRCSTAHTCLYFSGH